MCVQDIYQSKHLSGVELPVTTILGMEQSIRSSACFCGCCHSIFYFLRLSLQDASFSSRMLQIFSTHIEV